MRADSDAENRGLLWGVAVGLALGLALLVAPSALAAGPVSVNGTAYAVAPDGSGGYYAGGAFAGVTVRLLDQQRRAHQL